MTNDTKHWAPQVGDLVELYAHEDVPAPHDHPAGYVYAKGTIVDLMAVYDWNGAYLISIDTTNTKGRWPNHHGHIGVRLVEPVCLLPTLPEAEGLPWDLW